jgi:hypothetical protein
MIIIEETKINNFEKAIIKKYHSNHTLNLSFD